MSEFEDIPDEKTRQKFLEADMEISKILSNKEFSINEGVSLLISICIGVTWENSIKPEDSLKELSNIFLNEIENKRFKVEK